MINTAAAQSSGRLRTWLRPALLVAAALGFAAAIPIASALLSEDSRVPGAAQVRNVFDMLANRSPGERITGNLNKSKSSASVPKLGSDDSDELRQRALGKVFPTPPPPPGAAVGVGPDEPVFFASEEQPSTPDMLEGPLGASDLVGGGPIIGAGGFIGIPVAGGGSGGGNGGGPSGGGSDGGTGGPPPSPPPFSAVPEPSTWAMLLLGFGLIGAGMRRRRAYRFEVEAQGCQRGDDRLDSQALPIDSAANRASVIMAVMPSM